MRFVVQRARADVPDARSVLRSDLLQVLLCDSSGKPGEPWWSCEAGNGWEPFAQTTVVRHVKMAFGPTPVHAAIPSAALAVRVAYTPR
ncbi:hypothetical protein BH11MYX1_BH11MYX1_10820 [soil metagenome]